MERRGREILWSDTILIKDLLLSLNSETLQVIYEDPIDPVVQVLRVLSLYAENT